MALAPSWTLRRMRARASAAMLARYYDGASTGRRTQGWNRLSGDANAAVGSGATRLRDTARDLARNNPYIAAALATIVDHTVGWGIVATPSKRATAVIRRRALDVWKDWAETTACDADGRHDLAGLQKQVLRTAVEAGECLVRRRWRRPEDKLPLPVQLQLLEPDYLDETKSEGTAGGGRIVQGVQFDAIGRRLGYWLFPDHPGASLVGARGVSFGASQFVPASEILHIFKAERPGQVRGASWLAPVTLRVKDFDDYEDAALMKQKIAACLALIMTDLDGAATPLGTVDSQEPRIDSIEPGMIANWPAGKTATVVNPPAVSEHEAYAKTVLRAIATGLGVSYEDLTGDYSEVNFSSARMARLRHWARVEDWRWRMLVPQFCDPVWAWAMTAAAIIENPLREAPPADWTAPPMPMIEPDREGLAYARNIRIGAMTWPEMVRERGYDPEQVLEDMKDWNARFDAAGIILDSDPRKTTQAGLLQSPPRTNASPKAPSTNGATARAEATMRAVPEIAEQIAAETAERVARSVVTEAMLREAQAEIEKLTATTHGNGHGHTPDVHVTIAEGAIRTDIQAAPAPNVTVDARTTVAPPPPAAVHVDARTSIAPPPSADVHVAAPVVNVAPPELRIEEGAIQVNAPTTIAEGAVRVETPVTVAEGAVRAPDVHVAAPVVNVAPAEVTLGPDSVRVDVAPSAVTVEAPVVNMAPPPKRGVRKRVTRRDAEGRIEETVEEPIEPSEAPSE